MSNITKSNKIGILAIFVAAALVGTFVTVSDNMAFAGGHGKKHKSNDADQAIDQDQDNRQNAQCVSGVDTLISCNNLGFLFNLNDGNLAAGQQ